MPLPTRSVVVLLAVWLAFAGCKKDPPAPPASGEADRNTVARPSGHGAMAAVDIDDPQACTVCHPAIVSEWSASQHAVAHDEPIFTAVLALRKTREGDGLAAKCAGCHMPRVAERGVTCAACHAREAAVGAKGARMAGPHDLAEGASAAHQTGPADKAIVDGVTVCMRCHEQLANPAGVPTCTTGVEWRGVTGAATCVSCHMPVAAGAGVAGSSRPSHRSHGFLGPHARHVATTASAALAPVSVTAAFEGPAAVVTLTNLAPHGYPTGFPARTVVVELVGLDAGGAEVWRNFRTNPLEEAPDAVLNKVYVDEHGQPTIAPWSVALKRDTRLGAGEVRTLRAEVPAAVKTLRVRILARLVAPILAQQIGMKDDSLAAPVPVATATATR